ncbi:unnamed protein product [Caenorhabditis auriculariae]|uniref:Uncharacterized protein n=1 Tax=Caenorhabditis auriculariae TaxID=2777116 RepID=A0A8S1H9J9_9PELO|nr:unnamed protein product [Caenorhabditis auriculariae]
MLAITCLNRNGTALRPREPKNANKSLGSINKTAHFAFACSLFPVVDETLETKHFQETAGLRASARKSFQVGRKLKSFTNATT